MATKKSAAKKSAAKKKGAFDNLLKTAFNTNPKPNKEIKKKG